MAKKTKVVATEPVVEETKFDNLNKPKETKMSNEANGGILELDMNLADYEDFAPLPNGAYPATITSAEMRTSDKGNDYYYIVFQVHPNDYPADYAVENNPEGTNLIYARVQKPDPKNRRSITGVKNFMRALGIDLKTASINPGEWEGKKAKLLLKQNMFNGEMSASIAGVEALD